MHIWELFLIPTGETIALVQSWSNAECQRYFPPMQSQNYNITLQSNHKTMQNNK